MQQYDHLQQQDHQQLDYHLTGSGDFFANIGSCPFLLLDYVLYPIITAILCLLSVFVVFGNLLVVSAIWHENQLHSVTNYLIASLAAADCLVGAVVMPFSIISEIIVGSWRFGPIWCDLWHSFDVLASTASIMNLCAISLDRYLAITNPISYPTKMTPKRVALLILSLWTCSSLISFPAILWWRAVGSGPLQQIGSTQESSGGSNGFNTSSSSNSYFDTGDNKLPSSVAKAVGEQRQSDDRGSLGQTDELLYKCVFTDDTYYLLFSSIVSFYGPLCVMLYAYYCIYKAAVKQTRFLKYGSKQVMISKGKGGGGSADGSGGRLGKRALKKRAKRWQLYNMDKENGSTKGAAAAATSTTDNLKLKANGDTIDEKQSKRKFGHYDTNCDGISSAESYDRQHLVLRAHRGGGGGGGSGSGKAKGGMSRANATGSQRHKTNATGLATSSFDKSDHQQLRGANNNNNNMTRNSLVRSGTSGESAKANSNEVGVGAVDNQLVPLASSAPSTTTVNLSLREDTVVGAATATASDSDDVLAAAAATGQVRGEGGRRNEANCKGQLLYYESDKLVQSIVDLTSIHFIDCTSQAAGSVNSRKQMPSSSTSSDRAASSSGGGGGGAESSGAGKSSSSTSTQVQVCDGPKSVTIDAAIRPDDTSIKCAGAPTGAAGVLATTVGSSEKTTVPAGAGAAATESAITITDMSVAASAADGVVVHEQHQQKNAGKKLTKLAKERKAAKTLGIVVGVFILCWLPFFVVNIIVALCGTNCIYKPHILLSIVTWLGWLNSAMNPVIYACWSREFRRAFRRVLCTWVEFVCYDGTRLAKKLKLKKASGYSNGNKMYRTSSSIKGTSSTTARSAMSIESGGGGGGGSATGGGGSGATCGTGYRGYGGGASGNFRANNNSYASLLTDQQQLMHNYHDRQQQQQRHIVRCDLGVAKSVTLMQEEELDVEDGDDDDDDEKEAGEEEEEEEAADGERAKKGEGEQEARLYKIEKTERKIFRLV